MNYLKKENKLTSTKGLTRDLIDKNSILNSVKCCGENWSQNYFGF